MRLVWTVVLVAAIALRAEAQEGRGWSFSGSFNGSSNSSGVITKVEPVLGYSFNNHFSTYIGAPFYFVNLSSDTASVTAGHISGLGNAFLGFTAGARSEVVNFTSNLEFTAPTGDESRGLSTGHVTVDWTNRFSKKIASVTPFASIGAANTVSDTAFFVRPFTS